ncbi:MAG: MoxR family ATPase, partial [Clostridium celatum]|nr:MoxR family ATPase [Clostridium celatum]
YERLSKTFKIYKDKIDEIPREVFVNVIKGNVGKLIAEEFISFVEANQKPLISFEDIFSGDVLSEEVIEKIKGESHTRLYLTAMNTLKALENNIQGYNDEKSYYINRFIEFIKKYPIDLMVGIMKDMKNSYPETYKVALENEKFVEAYFESYSQIRG